MVGRLQVAVPRDAGGRPRTGAVELCRAGRSGAWFVWTNRVRTEEGPGEAARFPPWTANWSRRSCRRQRRPLACARSASGIPPPLARARTRTGRRRGVWLGRSGDAGNSSAPRQLARETFRGRTQQPLHSAGPRATAHLRREPTSARARPATAQPKSRGLPKRRTTPMRLASVGSVRPAMTGV